MTGDADIDLPGMEARLRSRLATCSTFDEVRAAGFLFHGSCEAISGRPRGGGFDGVFWTAETPSVAQAYIPRSGATLILPHLLPWQMDDPVRPRAPDDMLTRWALERAGARWEDLDVEEARGRVVSWRIPPGWPRGRDLVHHVAVELGHGERQIWEIPVSRDADGRERWMPAGWRMQGGLVVLHVPDLRIDDPEWGESDLLIPNHNRLESFARMAAAGCEAFAMGDLLQSDFLGNVGHRAVGLLPAALARAEWFSIPARRHDGDDISVFREPGTPEFTRLMEELNPEWRSGDGMCLPAPGD